MINRWLKQLLILYMCSVSVLAYYLFSIRVYFCSLQCSNSPDYTEPTQEPCVCPAGPPGLPGIKVSNSKKFPFYIKFSSSYTALTENNPTKNKSLFLV